MLMMMLPANLELHHLKETTAAHRFRTKIQKDNNSNILSCVSLVKF